jgi:hypothetical protein
MEPFIQNNL